MLRANGNSLSFNKKPECKRELMVVVNNLILHRHKFYAISRRKEFVDAVSHNMYHIDGSYHNYKNKINKLIENYDMKYFTTEIILKPNVIISFINKENPLLQWLGFHDKPKMFELFVDSLFHFDDNVLGMLQDI